MSEVLRDFPEVYLYMYTSCGRSTVHVLLCTYTDDTVDLHIAMCMCGCWSRIYFSTKSTYVFINFIAKPWGCFVCICMCVII